MNAKTQRSGALRRLHYLNRKKNILCCWIKSFYKIFMCWFFFFAPLCFRSRESNYRCEATFEPEKLFQALHEENLNLLSHAACHTVAVQMATAAHQPHALCLYAAHAHTVYNSHTATYPNKLAAYLAAFPRLLPSIVKSSRWEKKTKCVGMCMCVRMKGNYIHTLRMCLFKKAYRVLA